MAAHSGAACAGPDPANRWRSSPTPPFGGGRPSRAVDPGPYDEVGPVFVHPTPCRGFTEHGWPSELRDATLVGYRRIHVRPTRGDNRAYRTHLLGHRSFSSSGMSKYR
jgi:hypothetical protein